MLLIIIGSIIMLMKTKEIYKREAAFHQNEAARYHYAAGRALTERFQILMQQKSAEHSADAREYLFRII